MALKKLRSIVDGKVSESFWVAVWLELFQFVSEKLKMGVKRIEKGADNLQFFLAFAIVSD